MELFVFLCSLIIFVSFALMPLARRAGAPFLLIALLIGMLLGEDGPGRIQFSNFNFAFDLGSVALADWKLDAASSVPLVRRHPYSQPSVC